MCFPINCNLYCPPEFDSWLCWDFTRAGTVAKAQCPHDFKPGFSPHAEATKICNEDGTWFIHPMKNRTWSDYTQCANTDRNQMILYMSISGYSVSCVLLILSMVIFNAFRQLRCTRVMLHQHLFVSFIVTGVMWIMTYSQFMANPGIRKDNTAWCKIIHIVTQYTSVSNYFWMFCEGFFLHTIVVHAFSKQKKLFFACCIIGWGLPILPITAYVLARALDAVNDVMCWFEPTWTIWFLSTPIVVSLVVNFILLLNILRILLSKIRAFNSAEHNQNRRAVKATLILIPLLGLQNMLTLVKPHLDKPGLFAWDMASAVLVSYQGAAVALIYCFFNGEVLAVLKRRWSQCHHTYDPAMGRPSSLSTTAITMDDTSTTGTILKNGSNRLVRPIADNVKDTTELQLMMPARKSDAEITFKT
ncbi:hypothetical protein BsWGS_00806 [Bradybaena similaris]